VLAVSGLNQYGGSHILREPRSVPPGKVTALLGRNGVGKTTLLRTLMGLVPAATGTIRFGRRISRENTRTNGRAPAWATCRRAARFSPPVGGGKPGDGACDHPRGATIPGRIYEMFPVLKQMLHRRGGDLSGGQQQQLAIGRALAMAPKLLILDEPTEGIQPSIIKDIERVIRSLAATGEMSILLVEQYYDFAQSLADQYLVMERGEIIARGRGQDMERDGVKGLLAV
jgi:urea transport system ATP-binding protein